MRRYEERPVVRATRIEIEAKCDRCGVDETDTEFGRLIPVAIEVNLGEEFGGRTELDYCDDCLLALAPTLVAAGSRAPYVTGEDEAEDPEDES